MYKKNLIQKNDVLNVGKCSILFSGQLLVLSIKSIKKSYFVAGKTTFASLTELLFLEFYSIHDLSCCFVF